MRGFPSTKIALEFRRGSLQIISPLSENSRMVKAGFIIDSENDVYVIPGYGAYRTNVENEIESIDDLRTYRDKFSKYNTYQEEVELMDKEGYEFVLGPGAPASNGKVYGKGLYCKNYKEIAEREKNKNNAHDDIDEER